MSNQWMCHHCYPDGEEIGEIALGYWLIIRNEEHHILAGQGHGGDIIHTFPEKPTPEPFTIDDEDEANDEWLMHWIDYATGYQMQVDSALHFGKACQEAGWKDSWLMLWVVDKAGKLLESKGV